MIGVIKEPRGNSMRASLLLEMHTYLAGTKQGNFNMPSLQIGYYAGFLNTDIYKRE